LSTENGKATPMFCSKSLHNIIYHVHKIYICLGKVNLEWTAFVAEKLCIHL